ncbi:hypothetical protein MAQ5080_02197 [Marinomonas aquimarina]|uniref:Uncharacterized protein n=1 Tax=Marinomonas aquimarina TaxID=295068 RepID=A0A1A8TGF4_9GAMM|nr:hypothetical protein [Marinomonas aquimarina]SBS32232.1 hypothetical protein MAQ5080_02197 [Marinomonas aquimarina]
MIVGLIIIVSLLLCLAGYALFTQRYVYIHHTSLLSAASDTFVEEINQLEYWPSWLPWSLFDDNASVLVNQPHSQSLEGALVQLKGQHIGRVSCHIEASSAPQGAAFWVQTDRFYPSPIQVRIELSQTEDQQLLLNVIASSELNFWHRYKHTKVLKQIHADMRLLLLRLQARLEPDGDTQMAFELEDVRTLANVDAVTRPFLVSDHSMSVQMEQGFRDLRISLGPENRPAGPSFALYESADLRQHYFTGRLGIPIQSLSPCEAQPERITFKGNYMGLKYQGSYQHLWVAWHVLHTHVKLHHVKVAPQRNSLEVYEVSPKETNDTLQYVTQLYLPVQ